MLDRLATQARNAHARYQLHPAVSGTADIRCDVRRCGGPSKTSSRTPLPILIGQITARYRNDEITVIFDDNGAGIPAERRDDALRPFVVWRHHAIGKQAAPALACRSPVILFSGMAANWRWMIHRLAVCA